MRFELDGLTITEVPRSLGIKRHDDQRLEVKAGATSGPGYIYLNRSQALALADALRSFARTLS